MTEDQPAGKYKPTELRGPIGLLINCSTDDEDEFKAIQQIKEDKSSTYKANHKGKEVDIPSFYAEATINHLSSEVNKYLYAFALREKWEAALKKGKLLKEEKYQMIFQ